MFTAVTAPVVAYAHLNGLSLHGYLAVKPYFRRVSQTANPMVIGSLHTLSCVANMENSNLTPSQVAIYLGISSSLTYPFERTIERWLSISEDFLARQAQPALLWLRLLGHLASLEKLVPYGRLIIRNIQFQLHSGWSQTREHPLIQVILDQGTRDSIIWWKTLMNFLK